MRYTLRLLTAQQFQRAAALVCACEMLRRERVAAGDGRWGTTPFRIGLWVGSSVTPNTFEEAERQINEVGSTSGCSAACCSCRSCPWCGSRLSGSRERRDPDRLRRRVLRVLQRPRRGLRVHPAELARRGPAGADRGRGDLPADPGAGDRHGGQAGAAAVEGGDRDRCSAWWTPSARGTAGRTRSSRGSAGPAASGGRPGLPRGEIRPAMRLRPPDLIIQDELHLISDALGSMVGLYETAIDRLCSPRRTGRYPARCWSPRPRPCGGRATRWSRCSRAAWPCSRRRCWTRARRSSPRR